MYIWVTGRCEDDSTGYLNNPASIPDETGAALTYLAG